MRGRRGIRERTNKCFSPTISVLRREPTALAMRKVKKIEDMGAKLRTKEQKIDKNATGNNNTHNSPTRKTKQL